MKKKNTCCSVLIVLTVLLLGGLLYCLARTETPAQSRVPTVAESEKIAIDTTLKFGEAIKAGDLSLFRNMTSRSFQEAFSEAEFKRAFNGFIEQDINLLAVRNRTPVFTIPPAMTADGMLILQGYFSTQPSRVNFDYSYVNRAGQWVLSGVNVDIQPAANP